MSVLFMENYAHPAILVFGYGLNGFMGIVPIISENNNARRMKCVSFLGGSNVTLIINAL